MFGIGSADLLVCGLVGFFVVGPERFPGQVRDAARIVRNIREAALRIGDDLRQHLPEPDSSGLQDLRDVHNEIRGLRGLHPAPIISAAIAEQSGAPPTQRRRRVDRNPRADTGRAPAHHTTVRPRRHLIFSSRCPSSSGTDHHNVSRVTFLHER